MKVPTNPEEQKRIGMVKLEMQSSDASRYLTATGSATANTLIGDYVGVGGPQRAEKGVDIGRAIESLTARQRRELRHRIAMTKRIPDGYRVPTEADPLDTLALVNAFIEDEQDEHRKRSEHRQQRGAERIAWIGVAGSWGAAAIALIAGLIWG